MVELSELGKSAPKKFWKKVNQFRNKKVSMTGDLSVGEFQEHFNRIMNNQNLGGHDRSYIFPENNIQVEELDKHISESEVLKAIHSLKRGKSPGFDGILGDFFIDAKDVMVPYLVIIYNKIYESGVYPESWCKGLIVPIHKRGDRNDPNNYRGIMLISVFAKLFSLILRNRLNTWCEDNEVLNEFQFGFRVGRSTSDGIFILHSLVQHVLKDKGKLYCAFIDYEKAFDTVIHEALWLKLVENGISCKFTRILQSLYGKVLAAVKIQSDVSSFFDIALGVKVKQDEPLSPLMFILFINDVYADLKNADNGGEITGISINHICFFLLLFADDMILFTKFPTELQTLLNKLQTYSTEWGLRVNTKKTKICIFENRRSQHNQLWYYDGEPLDIVDSFCYLGMKFHKNGNLEPGVKALFEQALKAANQLLALSKRMSFDVKTKLKLFDSLVSPILLYASEVWGIYEYEHIDKIHIKFCKNILGVRTQSPNYAVYGDLGRYPLSVIAKERSIKFWLKILTNNNSLTFNLFQTQIDDLDALAQPSRFKHKGSWAQGVKSLLDNLGFSQMWHNQIIEIPCFEVIRNRIRDHFTQHWYANICNTSKLEYYCQFKTEFKMEKYVECISNDKLRSELAAFRLSAHNLDIERGRHRHINVPRENRICRLCSMSIVESEFHFLLVCPRYSDLRRDILSSTAWPSVAKFISIMATNSKIFLFKLSKFIKSANTLRSQTLEDLAIS